MSAPCEILCYGDAKLFGGVYRFEGVAVKGVVGLDGCFLVARGGGGGGGGGGGTQVQRGAAPALRISLKMGSFLRPPHVCDFVKEGYFFVPRYKVWG